MAAKYGVEKFTGLNDFGPWRVKKRALLVQQGIADALLGEEHLSASMTTAEKKSAMEKAHSATILNLGDKVLRKIAKEKSDADIWLKP